MDAIGDLDPWVMRDADFFAGGTLTLPRDQAPIGQSYVRPVPDSTSRANTSNPIVDPPPPLNGWEVLLGHGPLGDALLGLGMVDALVELTGHTDLEYLGPRPDVFLRTSLRMRDGGHSRDHRVRTSFGDESRRAYFANPDTYPTFLELVGTGHVRVHSQLPMRYYLSIEQLHRTPLPRHSDVLPHFQVDEPAVPGSVVFVSATSMAGRKSYPEEQFDVLQGFLSEMRAQSTFTRVNGSAPAPGRGHAAVRVLEAPSIDECLSLFATAQLVIGNDTGLTHLAAMTRALAGHRPQVVGLYGRHSFRKWSTGTANHHAVATRFAQMMAAADACPVRDQLDDRLWVRDDPLSSISPRLIADGCSRIFRE